MRALNDIAKLEKIAQKPHYPSESTPEPPKQAEAGVDVATPAKTSPKPSEAAVSVSDSSNMMIIPPSGRLAPFKRERIDPAQCSLWRGNPANFEKKDLSDLMPLIKSAGSNILPVLVRPTGDAEKPYEIIYGSRRYECCLTLNKLLLADIVECSDIEADALAYVENNGRRQVNALSTARYFVDRFEIAKEADPAITIERFANRFELSRQTMNDNLSFGRLPRNLDDIVEAQNLWSTRTLTSIRKLYSNSPDDVKQIYFHSDDITFRTPADMIRDLKKHLNSLGQQFQVLDPVVYEVGDRGKAKLSTSTKGIVTLKIDPKVAESLKSEIDAIKQKLKTLSEN